MSKSDIRSDIELTEKLGLHRCSCGRCCNAKRVAELEYKYGKLKDSRCKIKEQLNETEKQNKIMREALEFYAKLNVWGTALPSDLTSIDPCDVEEFFHQEIGVTVRGGKKARQALKEIGEL